MARAGSALWLLRHEVRMFVFNATGAAKKGAPKRGMSKTSMAIWIGAAAVLHGFAYVVVSRLSASGFSPPHAMVMAATGILVSVITMMLSAGLRSSVEALFERGDLDLLLSSPLSSRSIFTVRLAAIVIGVATLYLLILAPFAHAGLVLGEFRLLAIYPVVISLAALSASLAMLLTLGLVRILGIRRTRIVAQILGALAGAAIFLLAQLYTNSVQAVKDKLLAWGAPLLEPGHALSPDSLVWLPGHAILGAPLPVLVLTLAAVAAFVLTTHFTHRFFVHGVQQAASRVSSASRPTTELVFNFRRSLARAVIVKEWRLIARDPQLISQVLLQLLYMVPLFIILFLKADVSLATIGAGLTFLCGSLTGALGWVIVSAEDAPDLLRAAPCRQVTIVRAKLAAVALPPLAITAPALLWVAVGDPLAAFLIAASVAGCATGAALVVNWVGRPAVRGEFKTRGKGNITGNVFETLNGFTWSLLAFLMVSAAGSPARSTPLLLGAGATAALAIAVLAVARVFRRSQG
jgi:ABC-2 type transport system permease protein